ncbi:hypothetical protein C8R46DRAFT_1095724 [Mycena filopes]|nr:hypothetical protein C8R46DRAFT_1095724 [Mycena filopes]
MRFSLAVLFITITLSTYALGRPIMPQKPLSWSVGVGETQCSTERAAATSDCQLLLADPLTSPDWTNLAPADAPGSIFKPFCHATCCLFTNTRDVAVETLLSAGDVLMGCSQPANGLMEGVTKTQGGDICMADPTGAGSCFSR